MYTGLKQVCRQKDNAYFSKATKLRREKHTVNSTKFSLTLGFLLTLFIKSSLCQTDDTKREAVVTVKNIFQEVKVFGKVVCPNFLFKMTSRGLSEVKKSVVLTKRHYHLLTMKMVWKLSQNSPSGNCLFSLVCTYFWLFSLSDSLLLFHPLGTWLWCCLSDTVHGISVYFVQKLSLYLQEENACSAGLLLHTVARHFNLGGGTLERTQSRGAETAWSVVQAATVSVLDTWCGPNIFSMVPGGAQVGTGQQMKIHGQCAHSKLRPQRYGRTDNGLSAPGGLPLGRSMQEFLSWQEHSSHGSLEPYLEWTRLGTALPRRQTRSQEAAQPPRFLQSQCSGPYHQSSTRVCDEHNREMYVTLGYLWAKLRMLHSQCIGSLWPHKPRGFSVRLLGERGHKRTLWKEPYETQPVGLLLQQLGRGPCLLTRLWQPWSKQEAMPNIQCRLWIPYQSHPL